MSVATTEPARSRAHTQLEKPAHCQEDPGNSNKTDSLMQARCWSELSSVPSLIPSDGGRKNKPVAYHHLRHFFFLTLEPKGHRQNFATKIKSSYSMAYILGIYSFQTSTQCGAVVTLPHLKNCLLKLYISYNHQFLF